MIRLDEIRAREQAATPGPWDYDFDFYDVSKESNGEPIAVMLEKNEADVKFIAHSREDIPWLLDAMNNAIAELREALESDHLTPFAESRIQRAIMMLEGKKRREKE